MAKFWSDFKAFAMKGNVVDMAIGVVVGGAFGKIVTSLVNDIIMPLVGWLVGGVDLSKLHVELKGTLASTVAEGVETVADGAVAGGAEAVAQAAEAVAATEVPSVFLNYGNFIQEIVNFFIIALCIFLCIRLITNMGNKLRAKKEAEPEAPAAPAPKPDDVVLLEEIRDLLKNQK